MLGDVVFHVIADAGDFRGASFSLPSEHLDFLGSVADVHVATIRPGCTRGNHAHEHKREVLIVHFRDHWSCCWDNGAGTPPHERSFNGGGLVLVTIRPGASHAITNRGEQDLTIVGLSDRPYDPAQPDIVPRQVTP